MGLQKGQSGYAFRWLTPIFSLVSALLMLLDSVYVTVQSSLFSDYAMIFDFMASSIDTALKLYAVMTWMTGLTMLTLAILAFVMNKKGAYIFAVVGGGIGTLVYLIKTILFLYAYSMAKKSIFFIDYSKVYMLCALFVLFVFALSVCVCVFGAVSLPKCEYEKTIGERNAVGENLTYVGFENDNATYMSNYHERNPMGPVDPYAKPVIPEPEPPKKERQLYTPQGPTGAIVGTKGMYSGARFAVTDKEEVVIGRDPRIAQIVIGEGAQNVSREHCRIAYSASDNSYLVKDTSKNGTFSSANKTKLPHGVYTKVPSGTEIYLGDRSNMFRLG